jgi:hypothetical protein
MVHCAPDSTHSHNPCIVEYISLCSLRTCVCRRCSLGVRPKQCQICDSWMTEAQCDCICRIVPRPSPHICPERLTKPSGDRVLTLSKLNPPKPTDLTDKASPGVNTVQSSSTFELPGLGDVFVKCVKAVHHPHMPSATGNISPTRQVSTQRLEYTFTAAFALKASKAHPLSFCKPSSGELGCCRFARETGSR